MLQDTDRSTQTEAHRDFWRREFPGRTDSVVLPFDRSRPPAPSYARDTVSVCLDAGLSASLDALARRLNVAYEAVLLAGFKSLLFRYSGQETLIVGLTVAGAAPADGEAPTVLLPIRTRWDAEMEVTATDLIEDVGRRIVEAAAHAEYPLLELQSSAGAEDQGYGHRLFNTALRVACAAGAAPAGSPADDPRLSEFLVQCDVVVTAALAPTGLTLTGDYDAEIFDPVTVRRMLDHLGVILEGVARDPSAVIVRLPMLTQAEQREILEEWNTALAAFAPGRTLHELFEAQVEGTPEAIALTCGAESLTYQEVNRRANRVAHALRRHGVGPESIVGICLDRSIELVVGLIGILKSGGAYLPIDLAYPRDRLAFMLEDSRARVLLTLTKLVADLPEHGAAVVCLDTMDLATPRAGEESTPESGADARSLAYVIFTSGSTGTPKGVLITHHNVVRLFQATDGWYHFDDKDVWTLFHSSAFDFSVWEIWGALLYGGRLVVVPYLTSRSPEEFYELLRAERVTVLNQTPSAFQQLIQVEEASGGGSDLALRYVIFGGEALELQSLRPWFQRHGDQLPQLVNMYGITETTVHVTYRPLSKADLDGAPGSVIGVPIPDLELYVLDRHRNAVPVGVAGEIYVGGAGVARGYLRREELTAERFIAHPRRAESDARLYRTGDLGRLLPGRDVEYLGRADDQVKIRGFRIELGEIESMLCQHASVQQAVVVALKDSSGNKRLVAYLVASPEGRASITSLRDLLKQKLPEYMVPAGFVWLDRMPLTPNGKVDRRALPEPELDRPDLATSFAAPRTETEQTLASIWVEVLRLERVGVGDNFFELGGDSILGIQVVARARRAGLKLKPQQMFEHPRLGELAAVAEKVGKTQAKQGLVAGDIPLTPIQRWFFEQNLEEPQHYNQAFLLEVAEKLDQPLLERALGELALHHDALRLRYTHLSDGWRQFYSEPDVAPPLVWAGIADLQENMQVRAIEAAAASAQASLNLESGPLWRVAYFDLGPHRTDRLLIVIHHLAVDGISWQPLLGDLEAAYRQLQTGPEVRLLSKTTSYKEWADRLCEHARSEVALNELAYWYDATDSSRLGSSGSIPTDHREPGNDTEASARTLKVSLTAEETDALLQQVPAAYNTQINDVLLTALARGWERWTGSRILFANIEGHGREDLFDSLDLSRTAGWFTSIFPVLLELPVAGVDWSPGEALKSIKEQLRRVPRRGIGYGILRYLRADTGLAARPEPQLVFNYLGQFDQVLAGSRLFRFARGSSGAWHGPGQKRRYLIEINSMVIAGRLELSWTYSVGAHRAETIERVTNDFLVALRQLIAHCMAQRGRSYTPSDFPLTQLDQIALNDLVAESKDVQDIYPLSPMQGLLFAVGSTTAQSMFDQWHCTLRGPLNVPAFQRAWQETVQRHSILRSTIHAERLREPVQIVHRNAELPWLVEDWRGSVDHEKRWAGFLKQDHAHEHPLTHSPAMRFALVRLTGEEWKFLWGVPALLLDGWSWPLVFRDVSRFYEAICGDQALHLEAPRPYRGYLDWLAKQNVEASEKYWRETLRGFVEPTPLPNEASGLDSGDERYAAAPVQLSRKTTEDLQALARRLQLTLNTVVQGAWALLLSRQVGRADVVFGAAFSGRPTDLQGVESIVGPFTNNLPVRVVVKRECSVADFLRQLHTQLRNSDPFQFMPLIQIQRCSEIPWRHRPFDSLVVFQNYLVDDAARRLGDGVEIADFVGPIHTNYHVTLLAEPGSTLQLTLIYDTKSVARPNVERWGRDLVTLFKRLPGMLDARLSELQDLISSPAAGAPRSRQRLVVQSQNLVPPQTELEQTLAGVWQQMFGLDQVSIEENFFDLGGHSLLLVQMHSRLCETLQTDFPIVTLFEHPTIRSLARHLGQTGFAEATDSGWRDRAQRQREALSRLRPMLKKQQL